MAWLTCPHADVGDTPLVPGLRRLRLFPGQERALPALRGWVALVLAACPARDDVLSVATELGTNAVQHTASGRGGWFGVEVAWRESVLRVAVADGGGPAEPRLVDDPEAERGRGLLMVRGLSVRTGVHGDQRGRLVWADCAVHHPVTGQETPLPPRHAGQGVTGLTLR
jgi:anti-sigma regulatory factor (Ser/Thr protein kinase)